MNNPTKPLYQFKSVDGLNSKPVPSRTDGDVFNGGTCSDAAPFALQVTDDSMQPEFEQDCIIVVDPTGVAKDGAFVLVDLDALELISDPEQTNAALLDQPKSPVHRTNGDSIVLRQLQQSGQSWLIRALNPAYSSLPLGVSTDQSSALTRVRDAVLGVVVQRAGRRRSQHKRYE